MTEQQLRADIERCLNSLRANDPELNVEAEFEKPPLNWLPSTEVAADHPFVEILLASAERILGRRPKLSAFPGGTDAAKFHALAGIPTIPSFGPGWLDLAHGPNECVGVEAARQAAKIYAYPAMVYLSSERARP
jgi:acetylornithine deacetylase/succinyl-diaminopimelate desuccinylase-like protein